jgi:hypothetical protein
MGTNEATAMNMFDTGVTAFPASTAHSKLHAGTSAANLPKKPYVQTSPFVSDTVSWAPNM